MNVRTLWRGRPPPKRNTVRAGDIGAPASLRSLPAPTERRICIVCILLCHDVEKKVDGSTFGLIGTL
jgi:hypothetical protein